MVELYASAWNRHSGGVYTRPFHFNPADIESAEISRADLILRGVVADGPSFEIRAYFNNPQANSNTGRDASTGFAGRCHIFGHGFCGGDEGHCAPKERQRYDFRPRHHLAPNEKLIIVTNCLKSMRATDQIITSLTLVPLLADNGVYFGHQRETCLKFDDAALRIYSSPTGNASALLSAATGQSKPVESELHRSSPAFAATIGGGDDLKIITGIGEVLERRLKSMGLDTIDKIANLTVSDQTSVEANLKFSGRIKRDDWIGQAQKIVQSRT